MKIRDIEVFTNREWMRRTIPLRPRQIGLNSSTGEIRKGDGTKLWKELQNIPAAGNADVTVRVVAKANVTISTGLNNGDSLSGVTLATGDRVLLAAQTDAKQNGIYTVAASPARTTGFTTMDELSGVIVHVTAGTYQDELFTCTNDVTDEVGTDNITITRIGLNHLDLDGVGQLGGLYAVTPMLATDTLVIERADGTLARVTASVAKTYFTS